MVHFGLIPSESRYQAYLVRLWQDSDDTPWRALARHVESGEECRFATLENLFLFLHRRTEGTRSDGSTGDGDCDPSSLPDGCEPEGTLEEA